MQLSRRRPLTSRKADASYANHFQSFYVTQELIMPSNAIVHRVFISYTASDLSDHADVVTDVVRRLQWVPLDHRDWGASGELSVVECRLAVLGCDILVVLIAHRYGWIPTKAEGGDDETSITWHEVKWARENGIPVLPYIVDDDARWLPTNMEWLNDTRALTLLKKLKQEMKKTISGFFSEPVHSWATVGSRLPNVELRMLDK